VSDVSPPPLHVLLVDDDKEVLDQLIASLPKEAAGFPLVWDACEDFDDAVARISHRRYDLVVTDVYRDRKGARKGVNAADERAHDVVGAIRDKRFCPVIAFSDGSKPENLVTGPFIRFVDKATGNRGLTAELASILDSGVPGLARALHDELDRAAGSYLWGFLEANWTKLKSVRDAKVLGRIVRRRAAIQLGRLDPEDEKGLERATVDGAEYYICPPISGREFRLGEVLRENVAEGAPPSFRVVLTPHCHLAYQNGNKPPRATHVMAARTVSALQVSANHPSGVNVGQRVQSPAKVGQPEGRYWFLPGFLDMEDLYCDLLQVESIPMADLVTRFTRFAVLDTPFAEALQSCFVRLYSAVGLPSLESSRYAHLEPAPPKK